MRPAGKDISSRGSIKCKGSEQVPSVPGEQQGACAHLERMG